MSAFWVLPHKSPRIGPANPNGPVAPSYTPGPRSSYVGNPFGPCVYTISTTWTARGTLSASANSSGPVDPRFLQASWQELHATFTWNK